MRQAQNTEDRSRVPKGKQLQWGRGGGGEGVGEVAPGHDGALGPSGLTAPTDGGRSPGATTLRALSIPSQQPGETRSLTLGQEPWAPLYPPQR